MIALLGIALIVLGAVLVLVDFRRTTARHAWLLLLVGAALIIAGAEVLLG